MLRKVSKLFTGNIVAQIVAFVLYPLFARLYTPEEFGVYGLFTSIAVLTSIFVSGQYYMGVANPESDEEGASLAILSSLLSFSLSLILVIILGIPAVHFGLLKLSFPLIFFMPVYIFIYVSSEALRMLLVRHENLGTISFSLILNRSSSSLIKVIFNHYKSFGLIVSDFLGNILSIIIGLRKIKFRPDSFRFKYLIAVAKKNSSLPLFFVICIFFQQLIFDLPVLFIDHFFSKKELGYFVLLNKISQQPIWILAGVITTALLKDFVKKGKESKFKGFQFLLKVIKYGFVLSLTFSLSLYILGPFVFTLIFPKNWDQVSTYLPYGSLLVISRFMSATILCYLLALNHLAVAAIIRFAHCLLLILISTLIINENFDYFIKGWLLIDGGIELVLMGLTLLYVRIKI